MKKYLVIYVKDCITKTKIFKTRDKMKLFIDNFKSNDPNGTFLYFIVEDVRGNITSLVDGCEIIK